MVTKSFGKRKNFMQPVGRPKHALKVPCFFPFYVLAGGGDFFSKWANQIGFGPEFLAQFAEESEHSGGFTNPELPHQARVDTIFLYK